MRPEPAQAAGHTDPRDAYLPPVRTRVRTPDGVGLVAHDFGGDGAAVMCAHATGLHGLVWQPLVARLAPGYRCVAHDTRGHGDSEPPGNGDFDWRGLARDVLGVVDTLGTDRPFGLGHSSGGAALLLAEQARPGTFRGLYCYEPVIVPADPPLGRDPDSPLARAARRRRATFPSREAAYAHYVAKPPFAGVAPAALCAYVDHGFAQRNDGSVGLKCDPEHEARVNEMAAAHDCYCHLGSVACPVMLACGADTEAFGPGAVQAQAARLPRARTEVVAGLSHLGPLEDPDTVADSAAAFFEAVAGDACVVANSPGVSP